MPLAKEYAEINRRINPLKNNINVKIVLISKTNSGKPKLLVGLSRLFLNPIKSIIPIIK